MHFERRDDGILTCPFDHHTRAFAANYLADFDQVRSAAPLVWSTTYGGFWIATSHRVVRRIKSIEQMLDQFQPVLCRKVPGGSG